MRMPTVCLHALAERVRANPTSSTDRGRPALAPLSCRRPRPRAQGVRPPSQPSVGSQPVVRRAASRLHNSPTRRTRPTWTCWRAAPRAAASEGPRSGADDACRATKAWKMQPVSPRNGVSSGCAEWKLLHRPPEPSQPGLATRNIGDDSHCTPTMPLVLAARRAAPPSPDHPQTGTGSKEQAPLDHRRRWIIEVADVDRLHARSIRIGRL